MSKNQRRFRVALSFPGEQRRFVKDVADFLAEKLGRKSVFYDKYYESELARPDLDVYLQQIYNRDSELVVIFLCAEYEKKEWCGLEWRAIRELIKHKRGHEIMPIRFDQTEIPGLFSTDGYVSVDGRTPQEIGELILQRASGDNSSNVEPNSKQIEDQPLTEVSDTGHLIILGTHLLTATSVKHLPNGLISLQLLSQLADDEAALKALFPTRFNHTGPIAFAHRNDAFLVTIGQHESESTADGTVFKLQLKPEDITTAMGLEFGFAGHSADAIANMRAGRILLNNPQPVSKQSQRNDQDSVNSQMLDSIITGLNNPVRISECPMPTLFSRAKRDPHIFLSVARLQAIFLLKCSGTIEHVLQLTLGPIRNGKMHVRFRGKRRKVYVNQDATQIELEGECLLDEQSRLTQEKHPNAQF